MGFKEWPSWLKGGVIGILLPIFAYPFGYTPLMPIVSLLILPGILFSRIVFGFENLFISTAISSLYWFAFGSLIGWIVGKVKSRKESTPQ